MQNCCSSSPNNLLELATMALKLFTRLNFKIHTIIWGLLGYVQHVDCQEPLVVRIAYYKSYHYSEEALVSTYFYYFLVKIA